eukprot:c32102_g1_i1 orf=285-449(-)
MMISRIIYTKPLVPHNIVRAQFVAALIVVNSLPDSLFYPQSQRVEPGKVITEGF